MKLLQVTGYSNFPELPQAAQILWEPLVQIKTIADSIESTFSCGMILIPNSYSSY